MEAARQRLCDLSRVTPLRSIRARPGLGPHLILSRLRPPRPQLELVWRHRLLRELSASSASIVAVTTPGGFGKTIALSQWADSDPRPFAWLQADGADDDPVLFLAYVVAALGAVTDVDPMVAGWLQLAPPPVAGRILPALSAAVNAAAPFVLVIDDTHLITNDVCWQIVDLLSQQLPTGAQLCLSGRALPPLPLPRMRAEGRLVELGPANLALDAAETADLLRLSGMAATAETASHLCRITEGWATGVYLAALAGSPEPTQEWLASIRGDRREIAHYLASEVLERQPPSLARFLLRTSILARLSPQVCRAVTGDRQAGTHLRTLARQSLFVSALDDADEWFRYHHLFAEFLQAELASERRGQRRNPPRARRVVVREPRCAGRGRAALAGGGRRRPRRPHRVSRAHGLRPARTTRDDPALAGDVHG